MLASLSQSETPSKTNNNNNTFLFPPPRKPYFNVSLFEYLAHFSLTQCSGTFGASRAELGSQVSGLLVGCDVPPAASRPARSPLR